MLSKESLHIPQEEYFSNVFKTLYFILYIPLQYKNFQFNFEYMLVILATITTREDIQHLLDLQRPYK